MRFQMRRQDVKLPRQQGALDPQPRFIKPRGAYELASDLPFRAYILNDLCRSLCGHDSGAI